MNKAALVARLARDTSLTKADANRLLLAFVAEVSRRLRKGEKVKLVGFGVFDVYRRRPRTVLNPVSRARIRIPARRAVRFTAGKELRRLLEPSGGRGR